MYLLISFLVVNTTLAASYIYDISDNEEMKSEKVVLVVPERYIKTYPEKYQQDIWTVKKFIEYVKEIEKNI